MSETMSEQTQTLTTEQQGIVDVTALAADLFPYDSNPDVPNPLSYNPGAQALARAVLVLMVKDIEQYRYQANPDDIVIGLAMDTTLHEAGACRCRYSDGFVASLQGVGEDKQPERDGLPN